MSSTVCYMQREQLQQSTPLDEEKLPANREMWVIEWKVEYTEPIVGWKKENKLASGRQAIHTYGWRSQG